MIRARHDPLRKFAQRTAQHFSYGPNAFPTKYEKYAEEIKR